MIRHKAISGWKIKTDGQVWRLLLWKRCYYQSLIILLKFSFNIQMLRFYLKVKNDNYYIMCASATPALSFRT